MTYQHNEDGTTDDFYDDHRPPAEDDPYWDRLEARLKMRGVTRMTGPTA